MVDRDSRDVDEGLEKERKVREYSIVFRRDPQMSRRRRTRN